jgi:integrase
LKYSRPEEYLGLQWKDIDFDQRFLSVKRALVEKKGGGFIFTELKTSELALNRHSNKKRATLRVALSY